MNNFICILDAEVEAAADVVAAMNDASMREAREGVATYM